MATQNPTNSTPTPQMGPAEMSALAKRLTEHADGIENLAARAMADDMRLAARAIEQLMRTPADLLVDITDEDGTSRRNVPLREAIGDDLEEYEDDRHTLLAEGRTTMGGGTTPLFHLTLAGNDELVRLRAEIGRTADSTTDENTEQRLRELLGGA